MKGDEYMKEEKENGWKRNKTKRKLRAPKTGW